MKTAEEKANEFLDKNIGDLLGSPFDAAYNGFLAGYSEAMRWKDPGVEQPEDGEPVIVKYMTARGITKYGIAKYFELGIGNPWTIEGSTGREVIGWRPIE